MRSLWYLQWWESLRIVRAENKVETSFIGQPFRKTIHHEWSIPSIFSQKTIEQLEIIPYVVLAVIAKVNDLVINEKWGMRSTVWFRKNDSRKRKMKSPKGIMFCTTTCHQLTGHAKSYTAQKMKFSIQDFFIKWDQIRSFLRIWSHLLKKSWMENFIFCAVVAESSNLQAIRTFSPVSKCY